MWFPSAPLRSSCFVLSINKTQHEVNEKKNAVGTLNKSFKGWLTLDQKRQTIIILLHFLKPFSLFSWFWIFNSPFFDVVFVMSSLTEDVLQEFGLSDEYSFIGVVDCGDIKLVDNWFPVESFVTRPPSCGWWEFDKWGYQVGLRGGQQESRIVWWRWLLFSKRNLS